MREWESWWRSVRGLVVRGDGDGGDEDSDDNGAETLHSVVDVKVALHICCSRVAYRASHVTRHMSHVTGGQLRGSVVHALLVGISCRSRARDCGGG
jgi:hypothetical protein